MSGSVGAECAACAAVAAGVSAVLLCHYTRSNWRTVGKLTLAAVYCCFLITIVPVAFLIADISAATTPAGGGGAAPVGWLKWLWRFIFWLTQIMSWVLMPILQCYGPAGEFTVKGRLKASLKENLKLYFVVGVVGVIGIVIIAVRNKMGWSEVMAFCIASSNAFGLLCIILLLGYGIAQIPRKLWFHSTLSNTVAHLHWSAAQLHEDLDDAELRYTDLRNLLAELDARAKDGEKARCLEVIDAVAAAGDRRGDGSAADASPSQRRPPSRTRGAAARYFDDDDDMQDVDFLEPDGLVKLHRKAKAVVHSVRARRRQWQLLCDEALLMEDGAQHAAPSSPAEAPPPPRSGVRWLYVTRLRRGVYRAAAVSAGVLSLLLVWCESVALPLGMPMLSPVKVLVRDAASGSGGLHTLSLLILLPYAAGACYWTLFNLKGFEWCLLVSHCSSGESLCFTGYFLCRLILPLCYNFLLISFLASPSSGVAFSQFFGQMDSVALLGDKFNRFMPCLLGLISLAVASGCMKQCLLRVGWESFSLRDSNDGTGAERIADGKAHLQRERRERERGESPAAGGRQAVVDRQRFGRDAAAAAPSAAAPAAARVLTSAGGTQVEV